MRGTPLDRQMNILLLGSVLSTALLIGCEEQLLGKASVSTEANSDSAGRVTDQLASTQVSGCRTFISDKQPPANVRSAPVVKPDNIVGKLKNGTVVTVTAQRSSWLEISAPIRGWVAVNLSAVSCSAPGGGLTATSSNIRQLGSQAMSQNRTAADTLVRYSMQADGASAELLSETLAAWAQRNPGFLVSVLDGQPENIRRKAIVLLDYGLRANPRQQFNAVIAKLPKTSPTRQAWETRPRRSTY